MMRSFTNELGRSITIDVEVGAAVAIRVVGPDSTDEGIYTRREAEELSSALSEALRGPAPESSPPSAARHKFVPHRKYPWFCGTCGYAPHEALKHLPQEVPA